MYVIQADIKYDNEDKAITRYAGIDQFLCRPAWREGIDDNPSFFNTLEEATTWWLDNKRLLRKCRYDMEIANPKIVEVTYTTVRNLSIY